MGLPSTTAGDFSPFLTKLVPMRLGVCTTIENAATARAAGFDFVEENIQNFLVPLESDDVFAPNLAAARGAPVPVPAANCFLPAQPQVRRAESQHRATAPLWRDRFPSRASGRHPLPSSSASGGARQIPDGFPPAEARAQFLSKLLRDLAPLAQAHDVIVCRRNASTRANAISSTASPRAPRSSPKPTPRPTSASSQIS